MKRIAVVDYGMGNLDSMCRAIQECGGDPMLTQDPAELGHADRIVLPGVGSFADAMRNITQLGLGAALREQVLHRKIPLLGVCLGMQLLASRSSEGGDTQGLDLIPGTVQRLQPTADSPRLPHIGWNEVYPQSESPLFAGIPAGKDFYFVHSYHYCCEDSSDALATTPYCGNFISAVARENIMGVQFHPEKSQKTGFALLKNFLSW